MTKDQLKKLTDKYAYEYSCWKFVFIDSSKYAAVRAYPDEMLMFESESEAKEAIRGLAMAATLKAYHEMLAAV